MPGIAGIIGAPSFAPLDNLAKIMATLMVHEPFHDYSNYHNAAIGLWSGWAGESRDFSAPPYWNTQKSIGLIFSGEYFAGSGQTSCPSDWKSPQAFSAQEIIAHYEKVGTEAFRCLNGWFCGLLIDLRTEQVILFNDRYGMGRVYIHQNAKAFYFASEAKSILRVLPEARSIDLRGLAEYCTCGCVLENRTLYKEISLLPPGAAWTFSPKHPVRKQFYFTSKEWETPTPLGASEFVSQFKETFKDRLSKYFQGEKAIGMSLTGGLDGRLIMACAHPLRGSLPCYTFGGPYRDCSDVKGARKVADACKQSHIVLHADCELLKNFGALAEKSVYITDGSMDVTGAVELYLNRKARMIAPVRMTGDFGSEIIRGNIAFRPRVVNRAIYDCAFLHYCEEARQIYNEHLATSHKLSFIAFKQLPWHHYPRFALEQSQLTFRTPYLDNELVALMYRTPWALEENQNLMLSLIAEESPILARIPTDRGILHRPLPVLYFAHRLYQDFTIRAEYAYDYGMPQWLASVDGKLARFRLDRLFLGRHKFYHFRVWYRDQLAKYVQAILLDTRTLTRPYLNRHALERLVKSHVSGARNFTTDIHQLLTCELIQRQLIES